MDDSHIVFSGEIRLYSWSDTSRSGPRITFDLSDPNDIEKFKLLTVSKGGNTGHRLAAVMVEIGDDEKPVAQAAPKPRPGELCVMACTFCADKQFWLWCAFRPEFTGGEEGAKAVILEVCRITSRKHLDTEPMAADRFHKLIREPYLAWRKQP